MMMPTLMIRLGVLCVLMHASTAFMATKPVQQLAGVSTMTRNNVILSSSFFDDFEDFKMNDDKNKDKSGGDGKGNNEDEEDEDDDEDDDDDDDDEYGELDVEAFRSKMGNIFGSESDAPPKEKAAPPVMPQGVSDVDAVDQLISFARSKQKSDEEEKEKVDDKEWAKPAKLEPGVVLLANPAKFCSDFGPKPSTPNPSLLAKFGLTVPPPAELGPDRRADLLPVLMFVEQDILRGSRAVLLNRRTGYLLGDLEAAEGSSGNNDDPSSMAPMLEKFCIQPLWFGGVDNHSSGLSMLHQCPAVTGAKKVSEDGLYWGGDPNQAQDAMEDPSLERPMSGFQFKFFVQSTMWNPLMLQREIDNGNWIVARVAKDVLFKSRDRMGTRRAVPLWTEIMELMGGEHAEIKKDFYGEK